MHPAYVSLGFEFCTKVSDLYLYFMFNLIYNQELQLAMQLVECGNTLQLATQIAITQ